ncbi:MAG TPA: glycoside hydrolase family 43 protein [Acidimicrobiales bacterium]
MTGSRRAGTVAVAVACALSGLVVAVSALGVSPAGAHALPRTSTGVSAPVYDADAPDPDVIRVGSTYYAYTTGSVLGNVPVLSSTDLAHWQPMGDALPTLPAWSEVGRTWSPGVVFLGGLYVMYYATEVAATGDECISVATAAAPTGPFVDTSTAPFICQTSLGGSIDPAPFVDGSGAPFLYWKSNAGSSPQPAFIWAALLAPDGLSLASSPNAVLTQDQAWETTVEGPDMVEASGSYVLFYSGGQWNSAGYGVGYADCAGPFGPCTKPTGAPIVHSDTSRLGPGGASLFQDASGNWWMAYHAWDGPVSDYSYADGAFRSLWMAPVTFSGGTPTVAAGEALESYHMFARDGGVFTFGAARFAGSMGATSLRGAIVGGTADPATSGYWEVGTDGGVFAFDAPFEGSMGGHLLDAPVVDMAPTPDGHGYWLVASDGGIFSFGDAGYFGSMGARHLDAPIVGMAAMPQGGGYWLVASDGGVFSFGDAGYYGSMGGHRITQAVVAMIAGPGSGGYWLLASDGGVFSFGDAAFLGSMGAVRLAAPVVDGSR